jgi:hypothetical protein
MHPPWYSSQVNACTMISLCTCHDWLTHAYALVFPLVFFWVCHISTHMVTIPANNSIAKNSSPLKNRKRQKMSRIARRTLPNIAHLKIGSTKNRNFSHVNEIWLIGFDFLQGIQICVRNSHWALELKLLKLAVSRMSPKKGSSISWAHKDPRYVTISIMWTSELWLLKSRKTIKISNFPQN